MPDDPNNEGTPVNQGTPVIPRPDNTPPPAAPAADLGQTPTAFPAERKPAVVYGTAVPQGPLVPQSTQDKLAEDTLKSESMGSRVYHGVLGALAGTKDVVMTGYDAKGNPIYSTAQMGPGQQWKKIIAGAISGLAAGGAAGRGPGGAMRGFGAGYQATQQRKDQLEAQQRQQAQQTFENQQKAAMNSAQTSMLTNQAAEIAFRTTRLGVEAAQSDIDRMNKFHEMIASGGAGTRMLDHYKSMDDVMAAFRADPTLHDSHAQGQIVAVPHVDEQTGKIDGVDAAYVTKDWFDSKTDKPMTIQTTRTVDGKVEDVEFTVPARGMTNGQWLQLTMAQAKDGLDLKLKNAQVAGTEAETKEREAGTKKTEADTDLTQYELEYARTHDGDLPGKKSGAEQRQEQQEAEWGPGGYSKGFKPWHKDMVEPTLDVERGYQLASDAYRDYQAAAAAGKRLPTGAKSMLMLADHIQNTFGMGRGARQTTHMIEQHLNARGITDQMTTAFNHFMNGEELSAGQWKDFMELIGGAREQKWKNVMDDAHAAGFPLNKVAVPLDMLQKYGRPGDEQPQAPNRLAQARQAMAATPGPAVPTPLAGPRPGQAAPAGGGQPTPPNQLPAEAIQAVKAAGGKPVKFKGQPGSYQVNQAGQIVLVGS